MVHRLYHLFHSSLYYAGLVALLALGGLWLLLHMAQPVAAADSPPALTLCESVTAIPQGECRALLFLYRATNGPTWTENAGWLDTSNGRTPCSWYGVTCEGGHVTRLSLARNGLHGTIPPELANLAGLKYLDLAGNLLSGWVPRSLCDLTDTVVEAELGYNMLYSPFGQVLACLDALDPRWRETQTIAPLDLRITQVTSHSLHLSWKPLHYTADGGYYEVSLSTSVTETPTLYDRTTDKQSTGMEITGLQPGQTYFLRVRSHTPAHANHPAPLWSSHTMISAVTASSETVLMAVYFMADNDLSAYVPNIQKRLRRGTVLNPNVQVVMLVDRAGAGNTQLIEIAGGVERVTTAVVDHWGMDELDTANPAVLSWFLKHARTQYPASRHLVSIMGHGVALTPDLLWPQSHTRNQAGAGRIPALPKGLEHTPADIHDSGYLSTVALGQALMEATEQGTQPFDIVFLDQCFQGNLDTLYEMHKAADIFIASPNYAWLSAPYDAYLTQLAPMASNTTMAEAIIQIYQRSLSQFYPNAIFWIKGTQVAEIADAVSQLGDALRKATQKGASVPILMASTNSRFVDTTQCFSQLFELKPPDELMGIETFAQNLQQGFPQGDPFGVHAAAETLLAAVGQVRSTHRVGNPYIAPRQLWDYDDTLTILAPLRRDSTADVVWRASLYQATAPMNATWSPVPTQTITVSSTFAFVRDGRWDDFLSVWYTNTMTPTVGQWCNYRPPILATTEATTTLALTVTGDMAGGVRLEWDKIDSEIDAEYALFAQTPHGVHWRLTENLPLSQNTLTRHNLEKGASYKFMVVVRDDLGNPLALSNEVSWAVERLHSIYLPRIAR